MKMLFAALGAVLALSACAPTMGPLPTAPVISTADTVLDEKALIAAQTAYIVSSDAYLIADRRGLLPPAVKTQVRAALIRSYEALQLAETAYAAGAAATFINQVDLALSAAQQAQRLLPTQ